MRAEPLTLIDVSDGREFPITGTIQGEAVAEIDGDQVVISDSSVRIKITRQPFLIPIVRSNSGLQVRFRSALYGVVDSRENLNSFILTCSVEN